jgi:hypothetical protein
LRWRTNTDHDSGVEKDRTFLVQGTATRIERERLDTDPNEELSSVRGRLRDSLR